MQNDKPDKPIQRQKPGQKQTKERTRVNRDYLSDYMHQLVFQVKCYAKMEQGGTGDLDPRVIEVVQLDEPYPNTSPSIAQVAEAEILMLLMMPDERLEPFVFDLAPRFQGITGSALVLPDKLFENLVKARQYLIERVNEMYRMYASASSKERALARHTKTLISGALLVLLVTAIIPLIPTKKSLFIPPFAFICITGALGGLVGHIRELLQPPVQKDGAFLSFELESLHSSWYQRAVTGLIYAVIFSLMIAGGLAQQLGQVGKTLLPDVSLSVPMHGDGTLAEAYGMQAFFVSAIKTPEYAKLLVWSFICGFFQPLLPNFIDRLVSAKDAKQENPTPTPQTKP